MSLFDPVSVDTQEDAARYQELLARKTEPAPSVGFDPSRISITQWLIALLKLNIAAAAIYLPLFLIWKLIDYAGSH